VATFIGPSRGPVKRVPILAAVPTDPIWRSIADGERGRGHHRWFRSTRFAEGALWVDPTGYGIERLTASR